MKVVILCGGKGTRLREQTEYIPKALVEVGGKPILWHIMKMYSAHGFDDFVLCLGYLGDKIKEYFLKYNSRRNADFSLHVGQRAEPTIDCLADSREKWNIIFAETGLETNTGGRIKKIQEYVNDDVFFATYGDGLADLDLVQLLDFHRSHGKIGTVTVVNPNSNFGILHLDEEALVTDFEEKPPLNAWINGGFFVFNRQVFNFLDENSILEREPLQHLAAERQLMAYKHTSFWACMDTYKDNVELNRLWETGQAKWRIWKE